MYNAYRVRFSPNNKVILKCYVIFIVSMTTIYSVTGLLFDLAGTRSAFRKYYGYRATEFNTSEDTSFLVLIIQLASILVM